MAPGLTWYEERGGLGSCKSRWESQSWGQRSDGLVPPTQMPAHARLTWAHRKSITSPAARGSVVNERGPAQEAGCVLKLPEENISCQTITLSRLTVTEVEKRTCHLTLSDSHPLN